ncbi:carrier protein ymc1 [Yamadazyma tenuis]|uniref:Mitochondrial thiamine pyrophosphate carrier 1 n=1 Tax=Candida tenuis (strain ATCC 10573 / BCRC 21748 / CBS 615 / JCM 9827 / NBRC 10315 / NRRL Y-1498 / VKM Y-70) TaxID=590646 RepID=G3B694_CANTC|nr:mitochondrial carrier [Yamadazyma tenuis ATCC 10573]XP_006687452.1 uncharacterized protein CANTEDRAFT_114722 [Yamadazyma tenuis ATCC 10573]EGV63658.1 mitochondrial carrier [Yamadazyma tenuis ATCC 10573]EGV63659.1 hypothetical protein CANTEDRAFT_114722 [Yamadazyma tenuis ATCC 10573]WEJ96759.1 carrier protein ymc1 [Yamadazyma tenuis]
MSVDNSLERKVKDVTAGFVGGATQVLIGQPFDLVKIRLQTSSQHASSASIIKSVLQNEGLSAFYKGTLAPLVGVGACVSLQFYGFHESKRYILQKYNQTQLNLWPQTYICGALAGIINTPVTTPVEQLRILSQSKTSKTSVSQLVGQIYRENGARGLFRGFNITLLREIQSYGVWFLAYESTIQSLLSVRGYSSRNEISTPELLFSGALAGNLLWLSAYPLDVLKSNVQSDGFANSKFRGSSVSAAKHIYATAGLRGFWKGIGPCLLRATPCSAGTFASVELALRLLG